MSINSNHTNLSFDLEIDRSRSWLETRIFSTCGYRPAVLVDRMIQRLVVLCLPSYVVAIRGTPEAHAPASLSNGTKFNCTRAYIEIGSGKITVSWMQFVANMWDFLLHWAYCLAAIFTFTRRTPLKVPATLVFQVAEGNLFQNGDDSQFHNFCRLGPIAPLRDATHLMVESISKNISVAPNDITYARYPLIHLLRTAELGTYKRCLIAIRHIIGAFEYGLAVLRVPQLSLVGKEIAYSFISRELDRLGWIDGIVLTASNFNYQPLWIRELRNARVHMVWYSQCARPLTYRPDNVSSNMPALRWIRVDAHWVWTKAFAAYIKDVAGDVIINAVGPIVWYMPEMKAPAKNVLQIAIIDVPPYDDGIALLNGVFPNYHQPKNLFSFIKDVISLRTELEKTFHLPVSFILKPKREYNSTIINGYAMQDRGYSDYLEELASSNIISLEHPSTNLYSMISGSRLVIVYPFSSPAYMAEYLNVPSIYYDPTGTIARHDFGDSQSLINFANCPDDLLKAAITALSSDLSDAATVKERVAVSS